MIELGISLWKKEERKENTMKKKIALTLALLITLSLALTGCCLSHEWVEATCTEPKTCSKCGETEGEALGHTWNDATCTAPKTCSVCAETEGEALGHTEGEWETVEPATLIQAGSQRQLCSVCGETLATEELPQKAAAIDGIEYNFTPEEFIEAFNHLTKDNLYVDISSAQEEDGLTMYPYMTDGSFSGILFGFSCADDGNVQVICLSGKDTDELYTLFALCFVVLDPNSNYGTALASLMLTQTASDSIGSRYVITADDDGYSMVLIAPEYLLR